VNASASALTREGEVQSKIRKVRAFGRIARVPCAAIFGFSLVGAIVMLLVAALGLFFPKIHSATTALATTPQVKMWLSLVMGVTVGLVLAGVYQLYRLFGNLAAGAIYTAENVRRVRYLGLLSLLGVMLAIAIPSASTALLALGFLDASIPESLLVFQWSESLSSAVSAGLILLSSWIMDVGLYEKDHADALRREADLVI